MEGLEYILTKQISWADRQNIKLLGSKIYKGRLTYVENISDNLFQCLLPETEKEFKNGDGHELHDESDRLAKMKALHSSSALCINVFQYWKTKNISELAYALGLCRKENKSAKKIVFEKKFEITNEFSFDPNLDVVILNEKDSKIKVFGIECKFSEPYAFRKHSGISAKYLKNPSLWKDVPALHDLAKKISPDDNLFSYLHPAQLIKHILGLKKQYGKNGFRLLYLWYDVPGVDGYKHREEVEKFSQIVKADNVKFHSLTYQELIRNMKKEFYESNKRYINYLTDRYL